MANSAIVGVLRALLTADTAQFDAAMKRSSDSARVWSRDLKQIGAQATQVGAALTKTLTLPLVALGAGSAKAAIDFESSFANVRKTVDATVPALDAFAKQIRQMAKEIPATTDELNKIAALGGQMGVPIDQLEKFTRNVAALGVAVDGISTEDAAAGLAQIGNATGVGTTQVAEMASALVHLGNKSNATEADILEFTKRLVGAGHTVGMTVPEIMALGTAMANVGINAESGGTAMSTVISKMSKAVSEGGAALNEFARVADVSAKEFAAQWETKPIAAIELFIKGLAKLRGEGVDLNLTMGELGTEGIRVQDTLKRLAGASDGVGASLKIANEGFAAGNKHLEEAEKKYKTTANQLKILWNQLKDVAITIGDAMKPAFDTLIGLGKALIPVLDHLAKGFAALPGGIQLTILAIAGLVAAAGPLIYIFGQLAISASSLAGAFAAKGLATKGLTALLGGLRVALAGVTGALAGISLPITAVVAGIGALLLAVRGLTGSWDFLIDPITFVAGIMKDVAAISLNLYSIFWQQIKPALQEIWSGFTSLASVLGGAVLQAVKNVIDPFGLFRDVLNETIDSLKWILTNGKIVAGVIHALAVATGKAAATPTRQDTEQLPVEPFIGQQQTAAVTKHTGALRLSEEQLKKNKEAAEKLKKASEDLAKQIDAERKSLEALGLTTLPTVVEQFGDLNKLWSRAVADGVPLETIIKTLGPAYQKLADKAKDSNVELKALNETIALQKRLMGSGPKLDSLTLIGGGTESLMKVGVVLKDITAASLEAQAQQSRTTEAFEYFGLKTPQALRAAAQAAKDYYRALVESGKAAPEQLKAAREKVLETERAAAHETVSIWKTQIFPAVSGVMQNLVTAVNGSFAQMALGAKSFKEGFIDIWESIKSSVLNIMNSILGSFTNQFLKGMLGAMSGQRGAWSKAFSGLVGGGGGGGGWTGIAKNFVGMGGGAALTGAGYGAAGLATSGLATSTIGTSGAMGVGGTAAAGLSSAALIGLTAGIGAVVVAGIIAYQKNKNTTKETREAFAKELGFLDQKDPKKGDLGALYTQLSKMGAHGQELRHIGQSVIGKKDQEANKQWMDDVAKFMAAVKDFVPIVAGATGNITAGFTSKLAGVFERQTKDQIKALDAQVVAAQEAAQKKLQVEDLSSEERKQIEDDLADYVKGKEAEKLQLVKDTNAGIVANSQVEFDRLSRIMLGAYNAARAQGKSPVESIQAVGPAIDSLKGSVEQFGFAGNAAFEELLRWRDLVTANAPLLESVSGLTDLMKVMSDVGSLDKQMFADLQAQGLTTYQALIDAGFTEKEARMAIKPLIEEEIKLAKDKKLTIDEGTQALINQMRANGELEEDQMSTNDILKQGLGAIIKLLKGDLPEAWGETKAAGKGAAKETGDEWKIAERKAQEAADGAKLHWGNLHFKVPVDFEVGDMPTPPPGFNPTDNPLAFNVPGAQHGGIFTRPSVIGIAEAGPEAAIPLDRLRDMSLGGGGILEASINVFMDGRRVAETQIQHLKFAAKRIGVRPI